MAVDSRELKAMRAMKWYEVKGGIYAILASYWQFDNYDKARNIAEKFMDEFGEASEID